MRTSWLPLALFRFLLPPAVIFVLALYLYPVLQNCSFPAPAASTPTSASCFLNSSVSSAADPSSSHASVPRVAPIRILALGDPQLEGDTSLPAADAPRFPSLGNLPARLRAQGSVYEIADTLRVAAEALVGEDVPRLLWTYRKRLDLLGNDYYLAHVYRSVSWWTVPTHTVVLGDLLGSQWIGDEEFGTRARRFWGRTFRGAEKVPDGIMAEGGWQVVVDEEEEEWRAWRRRLVNVAGNHDVGYAGDMDRHRVDRFEEAFGRANWDVTFQLPANESGRSLRDGLFGDGQGPPELKVIVLNDMNLDGPAWDKELQAESWEFLEREIDQAKSMRKQDATILLTHVPLFKNAGICVDGPLFDYFSAHHGGGISEQNHLSRETSDRILDGLFAGDKASGIILNGHDHEGCNVYHTKPRAPEKGAAPPDEASSWQANVYGAAAHHLADNTDEHGVREITVRSMMGAYGGNAGLLSAWFDEEEMEWKFEYGTCVLGVQHIWWAVHVLGVVVTALGLVGGACWVVEVWCCEMRVRRRQRVVMEGESKKSR